MDSGYSAPQRLSQRVPELQPGPSAAEVGRPEVLCANLCGVPGVVLRSLSHVAICVSSCRAPRVRFARCWPGRRASGPGGGPRSASGPAGARSDEAATWVLTALSCLSSHRPQHGGIRDKNTAVRCDRTWTPAVITAGGEQIPGETVTL